MKRFLPFILFSGIILTVYLHQTSPTLGFTELEDNPLYRGFQASGADFYEINLQAWSRIDDRPLSEQEIRQLMKQIAQVIAPEVKFTVTSRTEKGFYGLTWEGLQEESTYYYLTIQALNGTPQEKAGETYLLVNISEIENLKRWPDLQQKLLKGFTQVKAKVNYSALITGTIPGRYTYNEQETVIRKIFNELAVKQLDGIHDSGLSSFSGFSPLVDNYLDDLTGKKVNVHAALRYHNLDDLTYLFLGSPLINTEY